METNITAETVQGWEVGGAAGICVWINHFYQNKMIVSSIHLGEYHIKDSLPYSFGWVPH